MQDRKSGSRWGVIIVLFMAGVIVAGQVGKAPVAIPLIRVDLGLSLTIAAWLVSLYALTGAAAGLPFGSLVSRVGMRKSTMLGLLCVAAGSLIGAVAPSGWLLLASRVIESAGYLAVMIGAPTLIQHFSSDRDRDRAMVLWSMFMPIGSSLVMFGAPFVLAYGWRELWIVNAILLFVTFLAVWLIVPPRPVRDADDPLPKVRLRDVLAERGITVSCFVYMFYVFQFFALVGLMPVYLVEYKGLSVAAAGTISAIMVLLNGVGNILAGILMRLKVPIWVMLLTSFLIVTMTSPFIFSDFTPLPAIIALTIAALVISAMTPAVIWSAIPRFATSPAILSVGFGLLMQTSNLGQLTGASAMGAWAEHFGWTAGSILLIINAAFGIVLALMMRSVERETSMRAV